MNMKTYLEVVCSDIDGKNEDIPVARFPIDDINDAVNFCITLRKFGGKCRIEFQYYLET